MGIYRSGIGPILGNILLKDLRPSHIQEYIALKLSKNVSNTTVRHHITFLHSVAYNARSLMGHTLPANPNELAYLQREPVGVVAIITPWNVPLGMVVEKLAPALTVGNTCIVKPPSIDALEALKLAELLDTLGLPPGTINFITGPGGPVGGALSSHRGVDMVAFTGSSEVGKEIMATASGTVKRLQLELGGKNPVIILEDADINAAAARSDRPV